MADITSDDTAAITGHGVVGRGFRVLGQAIRDEPRIFAVAVAGSSVFGLMTVGSAWVIGRITERVILPAFAGETPGRGLLALAATAIMAVSMIKVAGIYGRRLGAGLMQFRLQARYRREVTRRYLRLPLSWHHRHQTGTLLSNANADVEAAFFPIAPFPFAVGTLVMLLGAVVSLFLTDWAMALIGVLVFPALFGINVIYSRHIAPRYAKAQQLRGELSAIAHESFDGALVVKTMGREVEETQRFAAKAEQLRDSLIRVGRVRGLFDPLLDGLPSVGTIAVIVVGTIRLRAGATTLAEVVSVAFLFTVLAFPVRAIGWVLAELPRSVVGWSRVRRVLDASGDTVYGHAQLDRSGPATLRMDGVDFAYAGGPPVLRGVSFEVPAGKTVALVGPTGAGKSTIAALASRLLDPAAGRIALDGVPTETLTAAALTSAIALVPQIPFVFDDTVYGNIALDREQVTTADVDHALELAQADRFVQALPAGLDTKVGERGTTLSGGQRQRLTLARALAGRPRLLVLDDATSAVDPRVEAQILAGLRRSAGGGGASILVVAYRRATIALADEVVYLEHGRVVARGTHPQLLATAPGYNDLVTAYEKAEAERELEHRYDEEGNAVDIQPENLERRPEAEVTRV